MSPARTIFALSWRQSWHTLTRNGWAIAGSIIGGIYALGAIFLVLVGAVVLRASGSVELIASIPLVFAVIASLTWVLINVIVGVRAPLAPEQFCLLPVTGRDLARGALAAGLLSITGAAFIAIAAIAVIPFSIGLVPFLAALLCMPIALLMWFLVARTCADALASQFAGRRTRELVVGLFAVLLASSGLLLQLVLQPLLRIESADQFVSQLTSVGDVLQWVPLAAPVAVPASIAQGAWLSALLQLMISLATVALFWRIWTRMLRSRLTAPILQRGSRAIRGGKFLDRLFPATPVGAIAVKQLRYLKRDMRQLINLVIIVVFPLMFAVLISMQSVGFSDGDGRQSLSLGPGTAFFVLFGVLFISTVGQLDFAYDGDSLAWNIFAGVSGRADRWGRLTAKLCTIVPVLVLEAIGIALFTGGAYALHGILGAVIGGSLVSLATATALSVWLPGSAPGPDDNPLGKGSSGGVHSFIGLLINFVAVVVIGGAPIGFGIAALWVPWAGWVSLASGLLLGVAALWVSVLVSAPAYERRQARILAHVSRKA